MKNKILLLIAELFCVITVYAQNVKYINPMDIPILMSASFAELRPNHFHAGLDMSTSGVEGIPVKSVADGYVSRIKVSPYGYGYGLYIDHYDGHTTVYGHLSEYASKIDSVIRREQYKISSFDIDYYPPKDFIKVKQGEVVAYSGNTGGSGGPHLHFEVRDTESEIPLNPLAYLNPIFDNQAPKVFGVKIYPLDDTSQVAGGHNAKFYTLAEIKSSSKEVYGNIGFGINATDYFTAGGRPCGVVEISLYDNGNLVFNSLLDSVPFDKSRYINSFVDYAHYRKHKQYVQKSFVDKGNHLAVYHNVADKIIIRPNEFHLMKYVLKDFVGNKTVVEFGIKGKKNPNAVPVKKTGVFVNQSQDFEIDTLGIKVKIPAESLYTDVNLDFAKDDKSIFKGSVYTIGSSEIPVHSEVEITMPLPDTIKNMIGTKLNTTQIFGALVGNNNSLSYCGGTVDGNQITFKTKNLGRFVVATDTIAPTIKSRNTATILSPNNLVMIGIADNLSGISKYNCYIDGQWKIFEYDYKRARLISKVGKLELPAGNHELRAIITDPCGNEGVFEWKFRTR